MVNYCIVPNCTTRGTTKTNRGKVKKLSFFTTPRELDRREKWREALKLLKLETFHLICEKHFPEDVIRRSKKYYDASFNLIAEIPLKIPRLVENAIPVLNEKCKNGENIVEINQDGIIKGNKRNVSKFASNDVNVNIVTHDHYYTDGSDTSQKNVKVIENKMPTVYLNFDEIGDHCGIIEEVDNFGISFNELCIIASTIKLPKNWVFHYFEKDLAICELCIKKDNDGSSITFVRKCINIDNTLGISYSLSGKKISQKKCIEDKKIENSKDLEDKIKKFSDMDICCGVSSVNNIKFVRSQLYYRDIFDVIRHSNCSLLSTSKRCNMCTKLINLMNVNKHRATKRNATRKVNRVKKKFRTKKLLLTHSIPSKSNRL